jgi:hypothetical protein
MLPELQFSTTLGCSTFQTALYFRFSETLMLAIECDRLMCVYCCLQVVFAFAPGVSAAVWSNSTNIPVVGKT